MCTYLVPESKFGKKKQAQFRILLRNAVRRNVRSNVVAAKRLLYSPASRRQKPLEDWSRVSVRVGEPSWLKK